MSSLFIKNEDINNIIDALNEEYEIYAPKRFEKQGRYSDTDIIRYDLINSYDEIVFDEKSDYPAKEVINPISQTLFYFTEDEYRESKISDKKFLIFMHPCDVNAMIRQDRFYLENGKNPDFYYQRLREKVKIVLMECPCSWDTCFCVSMGTNKTDKYDIALKNTDEGWYVNIKDETLLKYFDGEASDYQIKFIEENELKVTPPEIKDKEELNKLKAHDMWREYDSRCLSCGACTIACPTCTCFVQTDIAYNENGDVGERRRTATSCQIQKYTQVAGGHTYRQKAGDRIRFKTLHKFHDYKVRFKDYHMCVGCGRCIQRCPQHISIVETVNKMNKALDEIRKEGDCDE